MTPRAARDRYWKYPCLMVLANHQVSRLNVKFLTSNKISFKEQVSLIRTWFIVLHKFINSSTG